MRKVFLYRDVMHTSLPGLPIGSWRVIIANASRHCRLSSLRGRSPKQSPPDCFTAFAVTWGIASSFLLAMTTSDAMTVGDAM
jgi:hypothetical protein